jgi:hypothetical protein
MQLHNSMMGGMGMMSMMDMMGGGMGGLGGFGSMLGFGGMSSPGALVAGMDRMMGPHGQAAPGYSMSSFTFSSSGGHQYQSQSVSSNIGGQSYSETKQAYSDSTGFQKAGWERNIGHQGRKVVKERFPDKPELTHKTYNNMREEEETAFDDQWAATAQRRLQAPTDFRAPRRLTHSPSVSHPFSSSSLPAPAQEENGSGTTAIHIEVEDDESKHDGARPATGPSRRRRNDRRERQSGRTSHPMRAEKADRSKKGNA